jgi:hypothetical protein
MDFHRECSCPPETVGRYASGFAIGRRTAVGPDRTGVRNLITWPPSNSKIPEPRARASVGWRAIARSTTRDLLIEPFTNTHRFRAEGSHSLACVACA